MLPNLIVIGAMKAGTTSLHYYLSLHPEIHMSADKEPSFFVVEKNWDRGVAWYSSLFPEGSPVRGEASPDYTKFPAFTGVPERILSLVPSVRIVYLVREPIARIVSHYVDAYSFGRVHKPIDRELAAFEGNHFVNCSRYALQLEQYLEHFEADQILVVTTDELRDDRAGTMRTVFEFVGVDPTFSSPQFEKILYAGAEKRRMSRLSYGLLGLANGVRRSRLRPYLSPRLMAPIRGLNARTARPIDPPQLDPALRSELAHYLRPEVEWLRVFTGKPLVGWAE
jgi:hypothetical protein